MTSDTRTIAEEISFLVQRHQEDESAVLARALREGVRVMYRDAVIEAYLLGQIPRERALTDLGVTDLEAVEMQRLALVKDVAWGLQRD